jgi:hypothetical protein
MKLRSLIPNFFIHVSVSDPTIGRPILQYCGILVSNFRYSAFCSVGVATDFVWPILCIFHSFLAGKEREVGVWQMLSSIITTCHRRREIAFFHIFGQRHIHIHDAILKWKKTFNCPERIYYLDSIITVPLSE